MIEARWVSGGCLLNTHSSRQPINKGLAANEVDVVDVFRKISERAQGIKIMGEGSDEMGESFEEMGERYDEIRISFFLRALVPPMRIELISNL